MVIKKETLYQKELERQKKIQNLLLNEAKGFKNEFQERTLKLVTGGFGLVAALAWNELIKELVDVYIKPHFGANSGVISLLIYAIGITLIVVFISYQLEKLEGKKEEIKK